MDSWYDISLVTLDFFITIILSWAIYYISHIIFLCNYLKFWASLPYYYLNCLYFDWKSWDFHSTFIFPSTFKAQPAYIHGVWILKNIIEKYTIWNSTFSTLLPIYIFFFLIPIFIVHVRIIWYTSTLYITYICKLNFSVIRRIRSV